MPDSLLTDEEKEERSSIPYPRILRYAYFMEKAGWDKGQVDAQPLSYLDDLILRQGMRNEADELIRLRIKSGQFRDEDAVNDEAESTRGHSMAEVRDMLTRSGMKDVDKWPDDAIKDMIGRA
jgi:hypothetical protein